MEVAGLAIGVVGLAGLSSACIDCFDRIQVAKEFGTDFESCLLRLDAAQLRFSRWAVSVGLDKVSSAYGGNGGHHSVSLAQQKDYRLAQRFLEQIRDAFETAEEKATRYGRQTPSSSGRHSSESSDSQQLMLSSKASKLHTSLKDIATKRQKRTSLTKKARWAISDKKAFERLIVSIHDSIDDLVELFPASVVRQMQSLCREEVRTLSGIGEDLVLLGKVCKADNKDTILSEAVRHELALRGHSVSDWNISGQAKVHVGDQNLSGRAATSHTVNGFFISDSADVWIGNTNQ